MTAVDYQSAIPCFVDDSRTFNSNTCSAIVWHCTGSQNPDQTSQQLGAYFAVTPLRTSVHYGIDRRGVITQYVKEARGSGGNGKLEDGHDPFWDQFNGDNLNMHTLTIECVNNVDNSLPLTPPQQASFFALVAYLCKKYKLTFDQVKSHASIDPSTRSRCPGPMMDWQGLKTYLENEGSMTTPKGWADNGTVLTAPNGVQVRDGFRSHILNDPNWNPNNWPLQPEQGRSPVLEQSNPSLGGGTRLVCRENVLEFTASKGVFVAWSGVELLKLESMLHI